MAEFHEILSRLASTGSGSGDPEDQPTVRTGEKREADPRDAELLDAYSQAVINVARTVGPAVIAISARGDSSGRGQSGGMGSGCMLTPDAYALTNSHVVHGGRTITATTEEGDHIGADLVGDDPATDL